MRPLTDDVIAELEKSSLKPFLLFEGEFLSGTVRAWSGIGNLIWDERTWVGTGHLGGVSQIQETTDVQATGVKVTLSGIPGADIALVLTDARRGDAGTLYLGFFDAADGIIADPIPMFSGRLDQPLVEDTGDTARVSISYENRMVDLQRSRLRSYDSADQQISHPGDKGFDYVPSVQDWNGKWGRA